MFDSYTNSVWKISGIVNKRHIWNKEKKMIRKLAEEKYLVNTEILRSENLTSKNAEEWDIVGTQEFKVKLEFTSWG